MDIAIPHRGYDHHHIVKTIDVYFNIVHVLKVIGDDPVTVGRVSVSQKYPKTACKMDQK